MYYASFGILSIIIHLIINISAIRYRGGKEKDPVRNSYKAFLIGIMVYYVSDVLWGFLFDLKIVPVCYADTVLYFLSMGVSVFLWMRFTVKFLGRSVFFEKVILIAGCCSVAMNVILLAINFFIPIMFAFDKEGNYYPNPARYGILGFQFVLFFVVSLYTLIVSIGLEKNNKLHHHAVGLSGLVMSALIVLQTLYPLVPFYAIGCLIANCIIHTFVEVDEKEHHDRELGSARTMAYKDPLTNVNNANAYTEAKSIYSTMIRDKSLFELGIVVFDVNNLKFVNDNYGHEAGDRYLQSCCQLICVVFKHSPVYRIGGDEFVTILEGKDYYNREELLKYFNNKVDYNNAHTGPVVAAGMEVYDPETDNDYDEIFERADEKMYIRKNLLKEDKALLNSR